MRYVKMHYHSPKNGNPESSVVNRIADWIPIFTGMTRLFSTGMIRLFPMGMTRLLAIGIIVVVTAITNIAFAQFTVYNHPELKWQSIETKHFVAHFHQGTEYTARTVLGIGEQIYESVTSLYDYEPDGKVHFVIRDHDDYSNGGAWYYDNKIEIWAKPLDFELRGTHHWLYDVVTHEFTHIIQLGASRTGPRWMPGIYFQYIDYEPEKRPDVLYGYPNRIMSWPIAGTTVPMWFAEGTAQYQSPDLGYDWWDSHRDMNLRVRALEDNLLTYNQMGVFGKTSLDAESVYNHGFCLVRYIANKWGDDAIKNISHTLGSPFVFTFDRACKKNLGISSKKLYEQWTKALKDRYLANTVTIRDHIVSGDLIHDEGFANLYPTFSPDGKKIAFLSNKGQDYMSLHRMIYYDIEKDTVIECSPTGSGTNQFIEGQFNSPSNRAKEVNSPVKGDFDWSPDGRYIAYSRKSGSNKHGSHFNDLYLWDIETKTDIRLTRDARLATPSFAPDGKRIVAVHHVNGTHNLAVVQLPDELLDKKNIVNDVKWELLTHFNNNRQIYRPQFAPDSKKIYTATIDLDPQDIYCYNLEIDDWQEAWQPVITGKPDDRDVTVTPDGKALIFASDRTGIFNLYRFDLNDSTITPLTNVIGGAFMPDVGSDGQITYSEFADSGYQIRWLLEPVPVQAEVTHYLDPEEQERPDLAPTPYVTADATPYSSPFNKLFILPRLAWDYGKFKPGFYAYTGDILNKLTLFSGVAVGANGERDLYLNGEYRILPPTLFFEAFNIVRKQRQTFDDYWKIIDEKDDNGNKVPVYDKYTTDYRFDLLELDLGARMLVKDDYTVSAVYRYSKYKAVLDFDDGGNFDYTYHLGRAYILRLNSDQRALHVASDIHPKGGFRGWIEYARENNRFLDGFEIEAEKGTIQEVYVPYNYHRIETDIDYYWSLYKSLVINPRLFGGWISDAVDPFYNLYAGGLPGLRGYSFYSLGGTKKATGRLSMRFPLATGIDLRWGPFYLNRIHGALFAEAGDAWMSDFDFDNIKRDVGAELRIKLFSWYGYPTDIQFTGAYGLDKFTVKDDTGHINEYGKNWRWYFTILFDFI